MARWRDSEIAKSFFHKEKKRKREMRKRVNNRRNDVLVVSCNTLQGRRYNKEELFSQREKERKRK
jgi:hypothetical protein